MSTCQDRSRELLPEYLNGSLSTDELEMVASHLDTCAVCASEVSVLGQFADEVLPDPGPWFFSNLPGKVTAQAEAARKRRSRVMIPVWAGGLAAAAISAVMLLQSGLAPQPPTEIFDYSVVETAEFIALGLEEEILSLSGVLIEDLDQTLGLGLETVSDEITVTMDLIPEGDGYETMDDETIRIFEDLVEEMTPERVGKWVMS